MLIIEFPAQFIPLYIRDGMIKRDEIYSSTTSYYRLPLYIYISWFNSSVSFFMHFIKRLKWSFSIKIKVSRRLSRSFCSTKGKIIFLLECYCRLSHKIYLHIRGFYLALYLQLYLNLIVNFHSKKSLLRLLCSHSSTHLCAKYQFSIHLHWLNESCSCRNKGKATLNWRNYIKYFAWVIKALLLQGIGKKLRWRKWKICNSSR